MKAKPHAKDFTQKDASIFKRIVIFSVSLQAKNNFK